MASRSEIGASQRADFYVYVLFRHDTGLPFYVGKGRGERWAMHDYSKGRNDTNRHKKAIIAKAKAAGEDIPRIKIAKGLTEPRAFDLERLMIGILGRAQFGGCLTNLTDGGDGEGGRIFSDEHRAKLSAARRKRVISEETKAKTALSMSGRAVSQKTRDKLSAAHTGRTRGPWSPEFREKYATLNNPGHAGHTHDDATRARISEKLKGRPWSAARRAAHDSRRAQSETPN